MRMGVRRHDGGQFPAQRLLIRPPFAGHDKIRPVHGGGKPCQLHNQRGARQHRRAAQHAQSEAEAARRAVAPFAGVRFAAGQQIRPMGQPRVQFRHHGRRRAFLRTEDSRRPAIAAKRVRHVTCDLEDTFFQTLVQPAQIHAGDFPQIAAASVQFTAVRRHKARPQRDGHARAAVRRRAAADADRDLPASRVQRRRNQLPRTISGCQQRISLIARQPLQAAGLRHFHERLAVWQQRIGRLHGAAQRIADEQRLTAAAGRRENRLQRAFAAVAHREAADFDVAQFAARRLRQYRADIDAAQTVLE